MTQLSPKGEPDPNRSPLDHSIIAELRSLDRGAGAGFLHKFVNLFLADTSARIEVLRARVFDLDSGAAANAGHTLKGSSSSIGAPRLASLCNEICDEAVAGDWVSAQERLQNIEDEFEIVREALIAEIGKSAT